jgi:hypothetical protein
VTITKPLNEIMKKRKLTLRDLYFKINEKIKLSRLSDIRLARAVPNKEEIEILSKYLELTDKEVEDLEDMKIDKILQEHVDKINNLMSLVPKDLKAGQEVIKECPNCGAKLIIARASINGHLWITCEKEGVLICQ